MGKGGKTRFRVILRESREGVSGNLRRGARGSVTIIVGEEYGEALLCVENLRYLGTTPNGWPYYYAGWVILGNGCKINMGPVSTDARGNGKGYWRFIAATADNPGLEISEIAGFAVTVEAVDGNPYTTALVVLAGTVAREKAALEPGYAGRPNLWTQQPVKSTGMMKKEAGNMGYFPYSWWPVRTPGMGAKEAPLLFGYNMCDGGAGRVAFGFPGLPDRPVLTGEVGEWRPTGTDNPNGYWIYHRGVKTGAGD